MEQFLSYLIVLLAQFIAVMAVVTVHEYAHAFAAYKCGDPTAKFSGRMSLNPMRHFDPLGILMFAVVGFGWAKPVPINPNNFNDYKKGSLWTSAAGVIANYLTAFLFYPLFVLVFYYLLPPLQGKYAANFLYYLFNGLVVFSLSFCVFNLLPVYPLDGFRILDAANTKRGKVYWFLKQYGYHVLLGLILLHFLAGRLPFLGYIDLLGYALDFAIGVFGKPITAFWNWIFGLFGLNVPFIF
ncbi:MAG: site-2 protease family protein [Clostridia bacterium]|nr:site-2 protease family protein [Clostridia bacterium]